jgi:hypothetical protein
MSTTWFVAYRMFNASVASPRPKDHYHPCPGYPSYAALCSSSTNRASSSQHSLINNLPKKHRYWRC